MRLFHCIIKNIRIEDFTEGAGERERERERAIVWQDREYLLNQTKYKVK